MQHLFRQSVWKHSLQYHSESSALAHCTHLHRKRFTLQPKHCKKTHCAEDQLFFLLAGRSAFCCGVDSDFKIISSFKTMSAYARGPFPLLSPVQVYLFFKELRQSILVHCMLCASLQRRVRFVSVLTRGRFHRSGSLSSSVFFVVFGAKSL